MSYCKDATSKRSFFYIIQRNSFRIRNFTKILVRGLLQIGKAPDSPVDFNEKSPVNTQGFSQKKKAAYCLTILKVTDSDLPEICTKYIPLGNDPVSTVISRPLPYRVSTSCPKAL